MGLRLLLFAMLSLGSFAYAEDKTCLVSGMHCEGCTQMVEGKLCDESKYSTCSVKITNEKKELGEVRLVTKDQAAKVDEQGVSAIITDSGYKMMNCKATPAAAKAKKS